MAFARLRPAALALALALPLGACESATAPERASLRVTLSSQLGAAAASSLISAALDPGAPGNGPVSLEEILSIDVEVNEVLILPGGAEETEGAAEGEGDPSWVALTVTQSEIDLRALDRVQTLAELAADAGVSGPVAAVRLVFGAASVTFEGGATEDLFIPSGKVTIPTPGLEVEASSAAANLPLTFLQEASVKKIIRTGRGLLMPPVIRVAGAEEESD